MGWGLTLSASQWQVAQMVGRARRLRSEREGRVENYADPQKGLQHDIEGAAGEYAFALLSGLRWTALDAIGALDVAPFEVKAAPPGGRLFVQRKSAPEPPYVLMRGAARDWVAEGWIPGVEAKVAAWWDDRLHDPCFAVPASALTPFEQRDGRLVPARRLAIETPLPAFDYREIRW